MGDCESKPADGAVKEESVWWKVQLAVSPIGLKISEVLQAYHTSVAIHDTEYSFTPKGLITAPLFHSHIRAKGPREVLDMGITDVPAAQLVAALEPYFMAGSYDILRKNCNSFSDCALLYLVGERLEEKYRAIDQIGTSADRLGLVRLITMGDYRPNPRANGFRLDQVLGQVARMRELAKTASHRLLRGQRVRVRAEQNRWMAGRITDIHSDGRVAVVFDGERRSVDVASKDVRPLLEGSSHRGPSPPQGSAGPRHRSPQGSGARRPTPPQVARRPAPPMVSGRPVSPRGSFHSGGGSFGNSFGNSFGSGSGSFTTTGMPPPPGIPSQPVVRIPAV